MSRRPGPRAYDPRQHSRLVLDGPERTPSRAMLRPVGFGDDDFARIQVGVVSTWSQVTPCTMHLDALADAAALGVAAAGAKPTRFDTILISDGISMGTPGMRYSLVSREVIADSIETVVGAQGFDALVALGGCDKNMPGCMIALARLDRPAIFVYGGSIRPVSRPASRATSSRCSRRSVPTLLGRAVLPNSPNWNGRRSRGLEPAAACTPPIPWPAPSRPWA